MGEASRYFLRTKSAEALQAQYSIHCLQPYCPLFFGPRARGQVVARGCTVHPNTEFTSQTRQLKIIVDTSYPTPGELLHGNRMTENLMSLEGESHDTLLLTSSSHTSNGHGLGISDGSTADCERLAKDEKTLSYWQGVCLITSRQIGAGIFSIPALVHRNTGSVGLSLILWVANGGIAYAGACAFSFYAPYSSVIC